MKMGITVGIVALMLMITSATIFLLPKNTQNNNIEKSSGDILVDNQEEQYTSGEKNEFISGDELNPTNIQKDENFFDDNNFTNDNPNLVIEQSTNIEQSVDNNQSITQNNTNIDNEQNIETVIDNVVIPDDSIGVLSIPKISLKTSVRDGHSLEVLKKTLGHFDDTAYWQGNIGILGHNSGNAGYFKNLTKLIIGDKIYYTTEYGTRTYEVSQIIEIADTDWSMLGNTNDNRITLITCVKGVPEKRLCIQALEII